jgi:hypothetical protein
LGPVPHSEVAIYAVNQQIPSVGRIAKGSVGNGAIRISFDKKILLTPTS